MLIVEIAGGLVANHYPDLGPGIEEEAGSVAAEVNVCQKRNLDVGELPLETVAFERAEVFIPSPLFQIELGNQSEVLLLDVSHRGAKH